MSEVEPRDVVLTHSGLVRTPPEQLENLGLQETLQIANGRSDPTDVDAFGCWLGASVLPFAVAPTGDVYVLLGKEREDQTWKCGSNRWSDFGGRRCAEKDRDCAETAGREFWEESCCVVSDSASWFGTYASSGEKTKLKPPASRGLQTNFGQGSRKAIGRLDSVRTPTAQPTHREGRFAAGRGPSSTADPRQDLAALFRGGGYSYRLVRTGNVRPLPTFAPTEEVEPLAEESPDTTETKPAAIVGKSYVTFACRVPWDPTISERFHNAVGWLGCLYDAVRLFHMAFYDLFVLPEEAKPLFSTSPSRRPLSDSGGEAPLPSRRASVVNFSSSGLTSAESLGSMPRLTLGMILPFLREATLTSLDSRVGLPKSATLVDIGWDPGSRTAWVDFLPENSEAPFFRPTNNPWSLPSDRSMHLRPGERLQFWVPAHARTLVDAILALKELVNRRERVKTLYRMVPTSLANHPSVSTETSASGELYSVVVKTEFLEKQAVQWWSLARLTEMMANNGVYRTEQTRSSCNEMLSVVCQLLAHDFQSARSTKRGFVGWDSNAVPQSPKCSPDDSPLRSRSRDVQKVHKDEIA
jgi:hypothetical protein